MYGGSEVSEFRRRINRMANSIRRMLSEVPHSTSTPETWHKDVMAPRTLGSDDVVEAWFLAQHFLEIYIDWRELVTSWQRYFGQMNSSIVQTSEVLDRQCHSTFLSGLSHAPALYRRLHEEWTTNLEANHQESKPIPTRWDNCVESSGIEHSDNTEAEALAHEIVRCDRHCRVAEFLQTRTDSTISDLVEVARKLDSLAERWFAHVSVDVKREARFYLHNHRHSMLRLSWLKSNESARASRYRTAFDRDLKETHVSARWLREFANDLKDVLKDVDVDLARRVLERISNAVSELGYDYFVEDISSHDFLGGEDSPIGSNRINLIPSLHKGACHPILVAVSRGVHRTAALGFPKVMRGVKTHLIECADKTKVTIVLCDHWDSKSFMNEHFDELRAHNRKGVQFLFLLVGAPSKALTRVPVNFESL